MNTPSSLQPQRAERKVPTVFRHVIKTEWFRKFSIKDRFKILFGCNLVVAIGVPCQHNPGEIQPVILGKVTKQISADEHQRDVMNNLLVEKKP